MTKKELQAALLAKNEIINKIEAMQKSVFKLSAELHVFTCAECGNPFVLNNGQYSRYLEPDFKATCSAGHTNIWR